MIKETILKYNFRLSARKPFDCMETGTDTYSALPSPLDIHQAVHFGILKRGGIRSITRGQVYDLNKGDCYLIAPWEPHGILVRDHPRILLFSISREELMRSLLDAASNIQILLQLDPIERMKLLNTPELSVLIHEFLTKTESIPDESQARLWHLICSYFIELDTQLNLQAYPESTQRLVPSLELIHQNNGRVTTLEDAAAVCSLGQSHFRHLFKDYFGISFGFYELQYRLNCAAESLLQRRITVKEAAGRWGFYDAAHFSRNFKKYFGVTPGKYAGTN